MVTVQSPAEVDVPSSQARAVPAGPWWAASLASVGAGVALLLAFPPYGWWPLAPVGVAALAVAVWGRRVRAGAGLGLLAGLIFFGPLLAWTNLHVGYAPWILLTVFQAGYLALLGAVLAGLTGLAEVRLWRWPWLVAVVWVAQEALRGRAPFGGFPWGRLAFSQADAPSLRFASLGGAPLVTFVTALAGGLLAGAALALLRQRGGLRGGAVGAAPHPVGDRGGWSARSGAGLLAAAVAVTVVGLAVPLPHPDGTPVTVAVVQGNVPRLGLDFNAQRQAVLNNHVRATLRLADEVAAGGVPAPQLVVWPENSSDIDPLREPSAAEAIDQAARAVGVPILVGAVLRGPDAGQSENAGIVWSPRTGPGQMYLKQHPVPFAEYLPMRSLVEPIAQAITDQAKLLRTDFAAGTDPAALTVGPARIGDVICFEVAYDGLVRDSVTHGAQLLAVQTNNATFDVAEAEQQLAMVRLRAVEHGRDSLMASTVGVSAFVTADGAVHDASEFDTAAVMVRTLETGDAATLATRLAWWPEALLTALAVASLGTALAARRRARHWLRAAGRERPGRGLTRTVWRTREQ